VKHTHSESLIGRLWAVSQTAAVFASGGFVALLATGFVAPESAVDMADPASWKPGAAKQARDVGNLGPGSSTLISGPWGDLELSPITLVNERSVLEDPEFMRAPKTWYFAGRTPAETLSLLKACGVEQRQLAAVSKAFSLEQDERGTCFRPTAEWTLSLPDKVHARVAEVLAQDWRNRGYAKPFTQSEEDFAEWLVTGGLSEAGREWVSAACYARDGMTHVSDFAEVFSKLSDRTDRELFAGLVGSHPSLRLRLRLTPDSKIDALAGYWGVGGRQAQTAALLRGLQQLGAPVYVDVVQLLPPMPRSKVNTYPKLGSTHNCGWSVLNFFSDSPEGEYGALDELFALIEREFIEVAQPEQLGDVVVFLNENQEPAHTAVYVAGGVVFTKNGIGAEVPWSLVEVDEVARMYGGTSNAPGMLVYRARPLEAASRDRRQFPRGS